MFSLLVPKTSHRFALKDQSDVWLYCIHHGSIQMLPDCSFVTPFPIWNIFPFMSFHKEHSNTSPWLLSATFYHGSAKPHSTFSYLLLCSPLSLLAFCPCFATCGTSTLHLPPAGFMILCESWYISSSLNCGITLKCRQPAILGVTKRNGSVRWLLTWPSRCCWHSKFCSVQEQKLFLLLCLT